MEVREACGTKPALGDIALVKHLALSVTLQYAMSGSVTLVASFSTVTVYVWKHSLFA